jgi:hypothetical protein
MIKMDLLNEIVLNENNKNEYPRLFKLIEKLKETSFYEMPASSKYHLNYKGGLAEHSYNVMCRLLYLTECLDLKWENKESPYIIGFAHDICKIDLYTVTDSFYENGNKVYSKNVNHDIDWKNKFEQITGKQPTYLQERHGELSVCMLKEWGIEITEEEEYCIRYHMGAFTLINDWTKYTDAVKKYNNVLYTHTADMMATNIDEK